MRQLKPVIAGAVALCLAVSAASAFACDENKASAASASNSGCGSKISTVSMEGKACTKSTMVSIFKDAPGTKTQYRKVNGGVALVVTAASKEYVPVVQNALLQHVDEMKVLAGQKVMGHCAAEKASAQKAGSSCAYKTETASVQRTSGASCCASKGASKVTMQANAGDCPDWMKVLCGADMKVQKTNEGVTITWTTEKNKVDELRTAAEKLQADLAQL